MSETEYPEESDEGVGPVEVPHRELTAEGLRGLVEAFVNREGTDYGLRERSLDEKVADVLRQLERGEACILFDPQSKSVNIAPVDPRTGRPR